MSQAALNVHEQGDNGKKRGGRSSQIFGLLFLLIVLATIGWCGWSVVKWMEDVEHRPISKLVISGERHFTTDNDVRQVILALGKPKTFAMQNVDELHQQIITLMPWVKQASIRKQWPDELRINLVEYVPFAYWNDKFLLDAASNVFSVPLDRLGKQPYPLLYGPQGEEKRVLDAYRQMVQLLAEKGFKLKIAELTDRSSWKLTLNDDIRLELGRKDNMGRIARFITLYPELSKQIADGLRIDYVDLRYETGAAVGWTPAFIEQHIDNSIE